MVVSFADVDKFVTHDHSPCDPRTTCFGLAPQVILRIPGAFADQAKWRQHSFKADSQIKALCETWWLVADMHGIGRFYVIFPAFRRLRRADSIYFYHYILAFEPDFLVTF